MLLQRSIRQRTLARVVVPLSSAQKAAAVQDAKRFSADAVRVIQGIARTKADGAFGPLTAAAVGRFQEEVSLPQDGIVDEATLDKIVTRNHLRDWNDPTITLVESFYDLDVDSDTLSVRYDSGLAAKSALAIEYGNLRVITLGWKAFTSGRAVRDAIQKQLDAGGLRLTSTTPVPTILTTSQANSAVAFNKKKLRDARSVTAVQALVGQLPPTGEWDRDTVQRVARLQEVAVPALEVDGKIGQLTMRRIADLLEAEARHNSVLRLIVDFYRLDETGLLDLFYDPSLTAENAVTRSRNVPGPSTVRIGPSAFAQSYEGLVHTVAHELEHVRQRRTGIKSQATREFLGESIELLSKGMLEEDLENFMYDAGRAVGHWIGTIGDENTGMQYDDQVKYWPMFVKIRNKVYERFERASATEQVKWQGTINLYQNVSSPA